MSVYRKKILALILAAGASKRLGQPKQNLPFGSGTMLNHIKEHLNIHFVDKTVIVLGAHAQDIIHKSGLESTEYIVYNNWQHGMGNSLSYACTQILKEEKYDGILITLGDLPMVKSEDYIKMIDLFKGGKDIVATKTKSTIGVPAIFGDGFFDELRNIKGVKGAKPLIMKNIKHVTCFESNHALADIDTMAEYEKIFKKGNKKNI